MTRNTASLFLLTALLAAGPAGAADNFVYGQIGSGADTAVIGYGHLFSDRLVGRIGLDRGTSRSTREHVGSNRFDLKPKTGAELEAMLDWYPLQGSGLRLSGGMALRSNASVTLTGQTDSLGGYTLNGHHYDGATVGQLTSKTDTLMLAPRLEIGWESAAPSKAGWRFGTSLNLQLDKPRTATLHASGSDAAMQADLAAEQHRFADDLGKTRFRAGVGLSATYAF